MAWTLLVRNGWVIDGSGAPRVRADVAVEGDRIAAVGPHPPIPFPTMVAVKVRYRDPGVRPSPQTPLPVRTDKGR